MSSAPKVNPMPKFHIPPCVPKFLLLAVVYLLGGMGFVLSYFLAHESKFISVVVVNLCAWLGYVYLGLAWAWGHKVSRNKVVAISIFDVLNFFILSVPLIGRENPHPLPLTEAILVNAAVMSIGIVSSLSNFLMVIYLVQHYWTQPGPGLQPHEQLQQTKKRIRWVLALVIFNLPIYLILYLSIYQSAKRSTLWDASPNMFMMWVCITWLVYLYLCVTWIKKQVIPLWQLRVIIAFYAVLFVWTCVGVLAMNPSNFFTRIFVMIFSALYLFFPSCLLVPHLLLHHWRHASFLKNRGFALATLHA